MRWRMTSADAARIKIWLLALYKLVRHPQTPRAQRWLALFVLAYALSRST